MEAPKTINHSDPEKELREDRLLKSFDRLWPEFEKPFQKIREGHKREAKPPPRPTDDMVVEILKVTRELQRNSEEILQTLLKRETGAPGGGYSGLSGYNPSPSISDIYSLLFEKQPHVPQHTVREIMNEYLKQSKNKNPEGKTPDKPSENPSNKPCEETPDKSHG